MTHATALPMNVAVELGHAWLQATADACGIRVLFIKGPMLHHYGLRDARVSSDVDVLVDPAEFDRFCAAIVEAGWRERSRSFIETVAAVHSRTFNRDDWPCDLDVHRFFPGFLADPAVVFDALWARRQTLAFAHRDCDVADRAGSILVLALHSLRSTRRDGRHVAELSQLASLSLPTNEQTELLELAIATGCTATLDGALAHLGVPAPPTREDSAELRAWRGRVDAGGDGAYFWLVAIRQARWWQRPALLGRALWPTDAELLSTRPQTGPTAWAKTGARVARWGRGLRSLPRGARALFRHRRRRTSDSAGRHRPLRSMLNSPWAHLAMACVVAVLMVSFVAKPFLVPSVSMAETLEPGDRILVNRLAYIGSAPIAGDIVVFDVGSRWGATGPEDDGAVRAIARWLVASSGIGPAGPHTLVKRVIAGPGQTVSCCSADGRMLIDGEPLNEPYVTDDFPFIAGRLDCESLSKSLRCLDEVVVPPGSYLVLGDNRANSSDSATLCRGADSDTCWRWMLRDDVIGEVAAVFWPADRWRAL